MTENGWTWDWFGWILGKNGLPKLNNQVDFLFLVSKSSHGAVFGNFRFKQYSSLEGVLGNWVMVGDTVRNGINLGLKSGPFEVALTEVWSQIEDVQGLEQSIEIH